MKKISNRYINDKGKKVWTELKKISNLGYSNFFEDWLDIMLNSLLSLTDNIQRPNFVNKLINNKLDGTYCNNYFKLIQKYKSEKPIKERPIDFFQNAWRELAKETWEKKEDIIGEIYQQKITRGEDGQFFTPPHIANVMTEMLEPKNQETINDPCCGSGRFLIEASKKNKNAILYGTDIDNRCAKMAVINLWLFDFTGIITHGNSLSDKIYIQWQIKKGGYLIEIKK